MKRASTTHGKIGISRVELRKAILHVKAKRPPGAAKKAASGASKTASASLVERYLGHFGVGTAHVSPYLGATKAKSAKKTKAVKKASSKKGATSKSIRKAS